MKSKQRKIEELSKLKEQLLKSNITIFTSFSRPGEKGLSVAQATELKRLLRANEAEYFVTKKTLMQKAFAQNKDVDIYSIAGSPGLVLGYGEPYNIAKKVYEFAKKNRALVFWGALLGQNAEEQAQFIDLNTFLEIAKMPSKEILLGRLVSMLMYPIRGLAVVLSEISKQKTS